MKNFESAEGLILSLYEVGIVPACIVIDDDHKVVIALDRHSLHRTAEIDMYEFEWRCGFVCGRWILTSSLLSKLTAVTGGQFTRFSGYPRRTRNDMFEGRPT